MLRCLLRWGNARGRRKRLKGSKNLPASIIIFQQLYITYLKFSTKISLTQILRRAKNVSTISCFELCHYYSLLKILIQNQLLWFYVNAQTWFHIDIHIAPMISSSMDISSQSQNSAVVLPSTSNKVYFLFLFLPTSFQWSGQYGLANLGPVSSFSCKSNTMHVQQDRGKWQIGVMANIDTWYIYISWSTFFLRYVPSSSARTQKICFVAFFRVKYGTSILFSLITGNCQKSYKTSSIPFII